MYTELFSAYDPSLKVDSYYKHLLVSEVSSHTIKAYFSDLFDFFKFLKDHSGCSVSLGILQNLKISDFRAWLAFRLNAGLSGRSNARAVSALKTFFKYLEQIGAISEPAIYFLRRPRLAKLLPRPIKQQSIKDIFSNVDLPNWVFMRDRALYVLLYATGLRIQEALNIKKCDLGESLRIFGKGKKERIVPLIDDALQCVYQYMKICPFKMEDNDFIFINNKGKRLLASTVDNRLKKIRITLNLPDYVTPHALRHSFASHLVQNGADLRCIQELLGHSSLSSTQIYTEIDDQQILQIYKNSHPLGK